ncbi:MAG TPA: indolepyruvate oxidoreductase subunit beta [Thermoleophilia bacterium]|nr:indolepyruvate oxidoreductase subunit beta [Thermoleophilia bacterium]
MSGVTTVSLVGVGGQGILLASAVLAAAAAAEGFDVKASEVKGMSQRGGSVLSSVRFGAHVWSPVSRHADVVIGIELLEGHRGLDLLGPHGTLVCAVTTRIAPGCVLRREAEYPEDLASVAEQRGVRVIAVDATDLARQAGTEKAANVALLGAASVVLPFSGESWRCGLEAAVPARILAVNQRAFALGRAFGSEEVGQ